MLGNKIRNWLLGAVFCLVALGATPAKAQTVFLPAPLSLNSTAPQTQLVTASALPGASFTVAGTLSNVTGGTVSVTGASGQGQVGLFVIDNHPDFDDFVLNVGSIPDGGSVALNLFQVTLDASAAPGVYEYDVFVVQGGDDASFPSTNAPIGIVRLRLTVLDANAVDSNTPEGSGLLILLGAIPTLVPLWKRRGAVGADEASDEVGLLDDLLPMDT